MTVSSGEEGASPGPAAPAATGAGAPASSSAAAADAVVERRSFGGMNSLRPAAASGCTEYRRPTFGTKYDEAMSGVAVERRCGVGAVSGRSRVGAKSMRCAWETKRSFDEEDARRLPPFILSTIQISILSHTTTLVQRPNTYRIPSLQSRTVTGGASTNHISCVPPFAVPYHGT